MRTTLLFSLLLTLAAAKKFHSKNHVDDIPKQFEAAFAKFWNDDEHLALMKRADDKEIFITKRVGNFRRDTIDVEDINDIN